MLALIDGDVLLHSCLWGTKNLQEAKDKLDYSINEWMLGSFCDDAVIAVGPADGKNFRDDLYSEYKQTATRVKGRKEKLDHFYEAKDYLYSLSNTLIADNEEADDLIGILSTQCMDSVIISSDKDLDQLPGNHWNPGILLKSREPIYYVQSKQQADRFFLKQMIMGDPIDKIPGLPKVGPVKAAAISAEYGFSQELAERVIQLYKEIYEDEWLNYFLANGKLLYLRRYPYETFTMKLYEERLLQ